MDPFVNEKDFMLLNQDHYTFAVLMRILKGDCEIIRSNHENLLLCHSASHYPARKAMHCCNQNLTRHMSFQLCIDTASPEDMDLYYSREEQQQYGVVGIKVRKEGHCDSD